MKIIVTHASAGAGHFKAAEAVYKYILEHQPQVDIGLVDIIDKCDSFFKFSYRTGYSFLINHAVPLWYFLFWITEVKFLRKISRSVVAFTNRINTRKFAEFLIQENPDFVISAHFLTSEIAANLKLSGKIKSKLMTIITDFDVHPFWLSEGTDFYIAASDFTKERLLAQDVQEYKIKVFGIPVGEKFLKSYDRGKFCEKFGLDKDKFTVLLMTGSFGLGPLEKIAEELCTETQVLVVCAKNKKLFAKLKEKSLPNVTVFGFVDNAQELMAVSDMIITKPGGLTTAETLSMELVPVFICAIPGQEEGNVRALESYGIGDSLKDIEDIKNIVLDYKAHPDKFLSIKVNIRKIKKPDCLKEICDVVCQSGCGPAA